MAYFSNGSDGDVLDKQCEECLLATEPCPVLAVQMEFNYDQCDNEKLTEAMNYLVNEDGACAMKMALDDIDKVNPNRKCFQRKLTFGDDEQIRALNEQG